MKPLPLTLLLLVVLLPAALGLELKTERYTLPNGLTVILHEDPATPNVTVNFLVKVGSKDEPQGRSGFAHLFEHLMFMGTRRVPQGEYDNIIEGYGGTNNAFTAPDMTLYYSVAPAKALPTLLWLEADRLEALGQNIDQKKLDLQREVVLNERRQNVEDSPYGEAEEAINQLLYPETHPYHRGTIGSPTDLRAATLEDVKAFFATYYVPNNISLLVAGNFRSAEVKPLIQKLFSSLARRNDAPRKSVPPMSPLGVRRVTFTDRVSDPKLYMVWRVPEQGSAAYNRLDVATTALQSRLEQALLEGGLAYEVSVYVDGGILGSKVILSAVPSGRTRLADLEKAIDRVLSDFGGMSAAELQTSVAATEGAVLSRMQDLVSRAQAMNVDGYYHGDPGHTLRSLETYRRFSAQAVTQTARQYLRPGDRLILTVLPQTQAAGGARDARPADLREAPFAFPKNTTFRLSNGVPVTYWQLGRFPLSYVSVVSSQGWGTEAQPGATRLLAALLDTGQSPGFDLRLQALGASLEGQASPEQTVVTLKTLSRSLEPAAALLAEALTRPLLSAEEFGNEQARLAQELDGLTDDPRLLSLQVAQTAYYGPDHPLGRYLTGSQSNRLTLAQIRQRWQETVNPANLRVFMAGDRPVAQARAALERTLGAWKPAPRPRPALRYPAPRPGPARLIFVDRPGAAQTMIRVFTPLEAGLRSPDAARYETLATALGGTFTSRLNANLREDKGYTYGASAGYVFGPDFAVLNTRASVQAAQTGNSIREIIRELTGIQSGLGPDEVRKALQTQISATLEAFATPESLVSASAALAAEGRTTADLRIAYYRYRGLTAAGVNRVAPTAVRLEHAVWVLVGDRKTVLPQLEGLGLPKLEEFNPPR